MYYLFFADKKIYVYLLRCFEHMKLESDWYKNWIYHICQVSDLLLGPVTCNSLDWFKNNSQKNILSRDTSITLQLMDIEKGDYKTSLFFNYASYFYIVLLQQAQNEQIVYISFSRYNGVDSLQYNEPIIIRQDMTLTTPYEIVTNIRTSIVGIGDEEYKRESQSTFQKAEFPEE